MDTLIAAQLLLKLVHESGSQPLSLSSTPPSPPPFYCNLFFDQAICSSFRFGLCFSPPKKIAGSQIGSNRKAKTVVATQKRKLSKLYS